MVGQATPLGLASQQVTRIYSLNWQSARREGRRNLVEAIDLSRKSATALSPAGRTAPIERRRLDQRGKLRGRGMDARGVLAQD